MNRKLLSALLAALLVLSAVFTCTLSVSAATGKTVNLGNADKNLRGDGYEWNNPDRILTLDGFKIDTADDFGLKIPDNCTVILKGKNTVKAAKYGVGIPGSVVFKGDGKLVVEAEDAAIYNYSYSNDHKLRFGGGSYELSAKVPLLSDRAEVSVTAGSLKVTSTADTAADTRVLTVSGGKLDAKGTLSAEHLLSVDRADVSVSANGEALASGNLLKLENVKLKTGAAKDSLSAADKYKGESCVVAEPLKKGARGSILFGDSVPITVDYLMLTAAVILIGCAVVLPILRKRARVKKLYADLEAEKANNDKKKR